MADFRTEWPSSPSDAAPIACDDTDATSSLSLGAALPKNEDEHPCWGCRAPAPPPHKHPYQKCGICTEKKYATAARFCCAECCSTHWQRHLDWHAERDFGEFGQAQRDAAAKAAAEAQEKEAKARKKKPKPGRGYPRKK